MRRASQRAASGALGFVLLLAAGNARAQDAAKAATAALPGSPLPPGVGLSPEAPQAGPAAGGRAPSFGAPVKKDAWAFTLGGSIFAWEAVGIGSKPSLSAPNSVSHPLHVPALTEGRQPFGSNTGGSLVMQYGNSMVSATVNATFAATGKERQGFYNAASGPAMSGGYLTINPPPFGTLSLQLRVGAYTESFAGPGQWGWGLYGPMLAVRGYGTSITSQYPISDQLLMNAELGFQAVPGVPENFVRGEYTGWLETGINSMVAHAHWGLVYKNQYTARLHYAHAWGFDERQFLQTEPRDGSMDTALLETRYVASPFGQLGLTFAFWNFKDANHVHDAIWWGLDYTKGGSDMLTKFLGLGGAPNGQCNPIADANGLVIGEPFPCTGDATVDGTPVRDANGTGKVFAISAEYDTSIAQLLWHPRPFNGQAPDLRVAAAAVAHWTLDTGDPAFKGASGFMAGLQLDYQMLRWFSVPLRLFGEDRDSQYGRYRVYSISPSLAFRTNWQSTDRIELIYTRRFYSHVVDDNPARPLDRNVLALGATINF
jgi:hypothetical protein